MWRSNRQLEKGFTIIEGLIVVFIVLIVIAILLPPKGAHPRVLVSRTLVDLRAINEALESYIQDHEALPNASKTFSFPQQLTTPTQYISAGRLSDPFGNHPAPDNPQKFLYHKSEGSWIIVGRGPDGDIDVDLVTFIESELAKRAASKAPDPLRGKPPIGASYTSSTRHEAYFYDPTNGTLSSGDIIATSDGVIGFPVSTSP